MTRVNQTLPELPGVRHEHVDAGGLRTHVALAGPADGPPVLLVHGWPQHWWVWRDVIGALAAAGRRVVCPDLRGHGWSDAPADGYEKEQLADDLLALLDALGIDRATWVGHDWGGFVSMLAALRAPERADRLLLLGIPHLWGPRDPRALLLLGYQGPIATPGLGPFAIRHGMVPRILRRARVAGTYTAAEIDAYDAVVRARPWVTVAMYRTFLTREALPIVRGRYARQTLQVPSTLIVGGRDLVTATMRPGRVAGQPNLTVERLDGVGHFLPEEAPALVARRALG